MKQIIIALCVLLLVTAVACSPAASETDPTPTTTQSNPADGEASGESDSPEGESGIEGLAVIGPNCPVEQVGTECPDEPYLATVAVMNGSGEEVTSFTADSDGRFRVALEPGGYTLQPENGNPFPQADSQMVVVVAGNYTQVVIQFDSGIR